MDSNKSFILMIIIGVAFIIYIWVAKPTNQKEINNDPIVDKSEKRIVQEKKIEKNKSIKTIGEYELIGIQQEKEYNLVYENNNIKVEFDPHDALIKHAWIKDTFLDRKEVKSYDLVQSEDNNGALRLKLGSWENEKTLYNITGGEDLYNYKRIGNTFIFTCKLKKRNENIIYTIEKRFKFIDNENIFKVEIAISNNKNIPINFDNTNLAYSIGWGPLLGVDSRKGKTTKRLINSFAYFNGEKVIKIKEKNKIFKRNGENTLFATMEIEEDVSWVSSNGHYFASLIYPDSKNYKYFFDYRDKENKNYYCGVSRSTNKSNLKSTFYIYIGPKIASTLKKYDNFERDDFNLKNSNISKLNERIMLYIGNGIAWLLEKIYKFVKNYGLAIIILTALIKILMFPLTHKSMDSQQKMSKLQPKIKELREKFKDTPNLLNKETMSLYKKEGVNPLGGCLPLLLQMPILIAMYQLLSKMVALKGARFLWVKDLSLPDSVLNFNFTIPMLNISSLNILPFLMVGVQVISSILTPNTQTNKQAKIMMWTMPVFFFFMFYNVASGLVLYWTIMNLFNLVQQFYINNLRKEKEIVK